MLGSAARRYPGNLVHKLAARCAPRTLLMFACRVEVAMLVSLVAGCTSIPNQPLNKPVAESSAAVAASTTVNQPGLGPKRRELADDRELAEDPLFVGITFSGGGTRAAALGYGVLKELEATEVRVLGRPSSLFNHIDILSGVSGGSVLAAYVGPRGRD